MSKHPLIHVFSYCRRPSWGEGDGRTREVGLWTAVSPDHSTRPQMVPEHDCKPSQRFFGRGSTSQRRYKRSCRRTCLVLFTRYAMPCTNFEATLTSSLAFLMARTEGFLLLVSSNTSHILIVLGLSSLNRHHDKPRMISWTFKVTIAPFLMRCYYTYKFIMLQRSSLPWFFNACNALQRHTNAER